MLTRTMQLQLLADLLAGIPRKRHRVREFQEPWRTCYLNIADTPVELRANALKAALTNFPDGQQSEIIGDIMRIAPGRQLPLYPALADIAADLDPVRWLWTNWIPRGMITLMGAVPGAGKSYVCLDLAHRLIANLGWPDGKPMDPSFTGNAVVYIDAEVVPQLINQRAEAWGMDRKRLFLMLPDDDSEMIDFSVEKYRDHLVEMLHSVQPSLLIIDSLSSINSRGENNVDDVRTLLAFLNTVAKEFEIGLILIHHLRKHSTLPLLSNDLSIDDFRGSSHIIAMSRSVLGLNVVQTGPEPDRNGPRKMQVLKTNLAAYPDPVGCEFVPLYPTGVMLKWGREPEEYEKPTEADKCESWLIELLTTRGAMRPKEIIEEALNAGYSRATVYRTRENLTGRIVDTEGRQSPKNEWMLSEGAPGEE